jgi:beta-mannanase
MDTPRASATPPTQFGAIRRHLAPGALLSAVVILMAYQLTSALKHHATTTAPWSTPAPASATVDLGVTTAPLARNAWRNWTSASMQSVNQFEHAAHKHISVLMWYADWQHSQPDLAQLRTVAARGAIPEITWEPWDYSKGLYSPQPRYTLESIIDGSHDGYIRAWASALARYGGPVRLRFAQEMNGDWYPWSEAANGNLPGQFVRAWRHVHDIFKATGETNVKWVWSPVASGVKPEEYPGSAYVDIVGLSGFNGGTELKWRGWRPPATLFGPGLAAVTALAPGKPIELSEVASSEQGGSKATWITELFNTLNQYPRIISVVWFNVDKGSNWKIQSSAAAEQAFAAGVASARYR